MIKNMSEKFWYKYLNINDFKEGESLEVDSIPYILHNDILRQSDIINDVNQIQTKKAYS